MRSLIGSRAGPIRRGQRSPCVPKLLDTKVKLARLLRMIFSSVICTVDVVNELLQPSTGGVKSERHTRPGIGITLFLCCNFVFVFDYSENFSIFKNGFFFSVLNTAVFRHTEPDVQVRHIKLQKNLTVKRIA